jgi:hypothetical protein
LGGDIAIHLAKVYTPYILAFLLGVIVAWQGCNSEAKTITKVVERPVPTIEYVERWRTDTVRFVSKQLVTRTDTIYSEKVVTRLDTMLLVDTLRIVEAWLSEVANYDTTVSDVRITWSNYQNRTENLTVQYKMKEQNFSVGLHGLVGVQTDFVQNTKPMFGVGLHGTIKKTYISANYGYNGQHYVGVGVGRNIISR